MKVDLTLERVGLIAGRGIFPLILSESAKKAGVKHLSVVAMHDETSKEIEKIADHVDWVYVGQIGKTIKHLKKQNISKAIMAGQIKPSRLFKGLRPDFKALLLLWRLKERNAETIFSGIANEFVKSGIEILSSTTFMDDYLAKEGQIGRIKPNRQQKKDIEFGIKITSKIAELNIGQTVVVKKGTVLAVEGFEGTDKAIIRGGKLGHGSATVIKLAKKNHDMRFDVPCIGMRTVESIIEGGIKAVAVETNKTLFLEKDKVIHAFNDNGIVLIGVKNNPPS